MFNKVSIISLIVMALSVSTLFGQSTNLPVPRHGHSMVVVDSLIYIFCGQGNEEGMLKAMNSGPQLNDLWMFNENNEYEEDKPITILPPRHNHGICERNKSFFIFGGSGEEGTLNDAYYFSPCPTSSSWSEVHCHAPSTYTPRSNHSVNAIGDYAYILGGQDENGDPLSDFWKYGILSGQWTKLADYPKRVAGHSTLYIDDDRLLVFGGGVPGMDIYYDEAWLYTVSSNNWVKLTIAGDVPPPVYDFSMLISDYMIYMIGGATSGGMNRNLYQLQLNGTILQSVDLGDLLLAHFNAYIGGQMVFFNPASWQSKSKSTSNEGYLCLFGGMDEDSIATNQMMRYDIALNQWEKLTEIGWQDLSTGIEETPASSGITLSQNYPNPFTSETRIQYSLVREAHVELNIFNLQGKKVDVLVNRTLNPGEHTSYFRADHLPGGVYFIQLKVDNKQRIRKALLTK